MRSSKWATLPAYGVAWVQCGGHANEGAVHRGQRSGVRPGRVLTGGGGGPGGGGACAAKGVRKWASAWGRFIVLGAPGGALAMRDALMGGYKV
jgi:hypothetical protein